MVAEVWKPTGRTVEERQAEFRQRLIDLGVIEDGPPRDPNAPRECLLTGEALEIKRRMEAYDAWLEQESTTPVIPDRLHRDGAFLGYPGLPYRWLDNGVDMPSYSADWRGPNDFFGRPLVNKFDHEMFLRREVLWGCGAFVDFEAENWVDPRLKKPRDRRLALHPMLAVPSIEQARNSISPFFGAYDWEVSFNDIGVDEYVPLPGTCEVTEFPEVASKTTFTSDKEYWEHKGLSLSEHYVLDTRRVGGDVNASKKKKKKKKKKFKSLDSYILHELKKYEKKKRKKKLKKVSLSDDPVDATVAEPGGESDDPPSGGTLVPSEPTEPKPPAPLGHTKGLEGYQIAGVVSEHWDRSLAGQVEDKVLLVPTKAKYSTTEWGVNEYGKIVSRVEETVNSEKSYARNRELFGHGVQLGRIVKGRHLKLTDVKTLLKPRFDKKTVLALSCGMNRGFMAPAVVPEYEYSLVTDKGVVDRFGSARVWFEKSAETVLADKQFSSRRKGQMVALLLAHAQMAAYFGVEYCASVRMLSILANCSVGTVMNYQEDLEVYVNVILRAKPFALRTSTRYRLDGLDSMDGSVANHPNSPSFCTLVHYVQVWRTLLDDVGVNTKTGWLMLSLVASEGRLPVAEVARRVGCSDDTVRRAYRMWDLDGRFDLVSGVFLGRLVEGTGSVSSLVQTHCFSRAKFEERVVGMLLTNMFKIGLVEPVDWEAWETWEDELDQKFVRDIREGVEKGIENTFGVWCQRSYKPVSIVDQRCGTVLELKGSGRELWEPVGKYFGIADGALHKYVFNGCERLAKRTLVNV